MPIKKSASNWLRRHPGVLATVVVPTLAAGLYWGVIASDQYTSEARVTVRQSTDTISAAAGLASLFGRSETGDIFVLKNQIQSLEMLQDLERELGVKKLWSSPRIDFWSRLAPDATQEEFQEYFQKQVKVELDETHGVLTVRARSFDPATALKICRFIVGRGETYINDLSHRIAAEQVEFVRKELTAAQDRYQTAQSNMVQFQNRNRVLDPLAQARAVSGLALEIQGQITRTEAELNTLLGYLSPTAPQVVALKTKLQSLRTQLDKELGAVAGGGNPKLNALAVKFRELEVATGFAENNLKAVLAALEQTRVESAKKLKHVVVMTAPYQAEESTHPERLKMFGGVFLGSLLVYGIGRMTISTIRDHRG